MRTRYAITFLSLFAGLGLQAQTYCSPTFANGCFSWRNQSIVIGGIDWAEGDCNTSDYTSLTGNVTAGTIVPMNVVNANWCGCSVWLDSDDDGEFSDDENLYYNYADMEVSTYVFSMQIPATTPAGEHRLRVIASWGSDGFNPATTATADVATTSTATSPTSPWMCRPAVSASRSWKARPWCPWPVPTPPKAGWC